MSDPIQFDFGISQANFFDHHFEKAPYLAPAALSKEVASLADMERLVASWDPSDPRLRIFRNGLVPPTEYIGLTDDVDGRRPWIIPEKFESLLSAGATLVLDRIDTKLPIAKFLCKQLAEFTQEATVANAYLAFGGCGTFGKHWDTHDVIAIQLLGRKRWQVFPPTHPLPLRGQTSKNHKPDCPSVPVLDQELNSGDALYIPRGWWHEATPYPSQPTLHLAIGIHTRSVLDYLIWFSEAFAADILDFRRTLRANARNTALIADALTALNMRLIDEERISEFLARAPHQTSCEVGRYLPFP